VYQNFISYLYEARHVSGDIIIDDSSVSANRDLSCNEWKQFLTQIRSTKPRVYLWRETE